MKPRSLEGGGASKSRDVPQQWQVFFLLFERDGRQNSRNEGSGQDRRSLEPDGNAWTWRNGVLGSASRMNSGHFL